MTNEDLLLICSERFLKGRTVYINGRIDERVAESVVTQIQYLQERSDGDIYLYINTPGGDVYAALSIVDLMKACPCDIVTIGTGLVASAGAVILAHGTVGKRYLTTNADVMVHQPSGEACGKTEDILITAAHIERLNHKMAALLSEATKQPCEQILNTWTRDMWLSPQEALDYGLCDHIGLPAANQEV